MADEKQLSMLRKSVKEWNNWREENPDEVPKLSMANLAHAQLDSADLRCANLEYADLTDCNLTGADLSNANFYAANLNYVDFIRANLKGAVFSETVLTNVDFSEATGLDNCNHRGRSGIDQQTLVKSRNVPLVFWRGCGLSDWQIEAGKLGQPGLTQGDVYDIGYEVIRLRASQPIQLFSPFISYSSRDDAFARRLYDNLQNSGIRCWYAPEDMKIGDRTRSCIDEVIHVHDKLLLVLSKHSVAS